MLVIEEVVIKSFERIGMYFYIRGFGFDENGKVKFMVDGMVG